MEYIYVHALPHFDVVVVRAGWREEKKMKKIEQNIQKGPSETKFLYLSILCLFYNIFLRSLRNNNKRTSGILIYFGKKCNDEFLERERNFVTKISIQSPPLDVYFKNQSTID